MAIRNPNLRNFIKNRRLVKSDASLAHKGYSFDYWAKKAKAAPPDRKKRIKKLIRKALLLAFVLALAGYASLYALEWQARDLASLNCDQRFGQPSDNHLLSLGGCR